MKISASNKFSGLLIIIILLLTATSLTGQETGFLIPEDAEKISKSLPDEMVLVRTDREIYLCGEKIGLNAYTYEGNWFMPVSISSVLYVELYSQNNRVISQNKLLLKNGKGAGLIDIPRNIETGVYFLRAYTNFMKNLGLQKFYVKKLRIVNPFFYNSTSSPGGTIDTIPVRPLSIFHGTVPALSIDSLTGDYLKINIQADSKNMFPLKIVSNHGNFFYNISDSINPSNGAYKIFRNNLPAGLISLILLDKNGDTISGSTFYNNPVKKYAISVKTDKESYSSREEIRVTINAASKEGMPIRSEFVLMASLGINDQVKNGISNAEWEIMEAELRKYYPEYPERMISDSSYISILSGKQLQASIPVIEKSATTNIRYFPETYGDIISGKLIYEDNKPATGIEVLQSFTGVAGCVESAITDIHGNFYFLTENEKNRGDLILKVLPRGKKTILITDNEFSEMFPAPHKEQFTLSRSEAELISRQFINIQVEDAYIKAAAKKDVNNVPEMIPFYGKEYIEYKFSDYARLPNMNEFIFEVLVGVIVSKENRNERITIVDGNNNDLGPDPLIMIDGIPVSDASIILGLNPEKVKLVRVVRSGYYYKKQVFDGILDILTIDQDAKFLTLPDNTYRYVFIHPMEVNVETGSVFSRMDEGRVPVFKTLLYWNPDIQTDDDGKAAVTFFAPDNTGIFKIECFGFTDDGRAGEGSCSVMVGEGEK